MDVNAIRELNGSDLEDYLWRRLRLEPPIDPPLGFRFSQEPPEQIVIQAWQIGADAAFRKRLVEAIRTNLVRIAPIISQLDTDEVAREQLASLAFLVGAIEATELHTDLMGFAAGLWSRYKAGSTVVHNPLYHMLDALGGLQREPALVPFWLDILEHAPEPGLRAIAYFGLSRSDSAMALDRLDGIVADKTIHLPLVVWHLAVETPGIAALARVVAHRPPEFRQTIRSALVEAGADAAMLAEFDEQAVRRSGFPFDVPPPRDPERARRRPDWAVPPLAKAA